MRPREADALIVRELFRDAHEGLRPDAKREEQRDHVLGDLLVRAYPTLPAQNN